MKREPKMYSYKYYNNHIEQYELTWVYTTNWGDLTPSTSLPDRLPSMTSLKVMTLSEVYPGVSVTAFCEVPGPICDISWAS